ncbi:MAG: hypothetical protein IKN81_00385 [Oscillospiraceae bacterium]|nr:hypothetical protein [Oscillospiraceae bacterium]
MDEPKLSWGRTPHDLADRWPKNDAGEPETPVFLTSAVEADAQAELIMQLLRAYDIPVIKRYDKDGTLGKVVLGMSGYGVSLYVPQSLLEDAQNLLTPSDDGESDN